mgnify:FL=1
MRVYILASQDKYSFAEKLLEDIRNAKIISRPLMNEVIVEISSDIKKEVANADIILAIIDKNFTDNVMLNTEFQLVLMESRKNKNKLLLPIVLDDADIPVALESMLYVKCNSLSKEDIEKTKLKIKSVLEHRRYTVKTRNLKENQSRTSSMIILTLAIEMLAILFIVMFFKEGPIGAGYLDDENIITISIGLIAVMLSITTLFTSYFSIMKRRWQEDDEEEIESYSRRLKRAIVPDEVIQDGQKGYRTEDTKKEIDALGRMMINLEDIKEFYTWSQKQAKASFILAVAMCIFGFILMIGAVMLPVVFRLSFEMSIIPAIGGVITELIAGTALVVYRNSLSQLNHYHKALHEDERFLSGVNLLGKFSTVEAQDDMLREIIRSEIQMNLAGLQENENMRSYKSSIKDGPMSIFSTS